LLDTLKIVNSCTTSHPKAREFTQKALENLNQKVEHFDVDSENIQNVSNFSNDFVMQTTTPKKSTSNAIYLDESFSDATCSPSTSSEDEPGYLDEEDYETDSDEDEDGLLGRMTKYGDSSLEARLESQRLEKERRKRDVRIIGKVGNIFSSASSWLLGY